MFAAIGLSAAAALSNDALGYLPLVPLVISGPWLAAVDFDVMRIPNRVLAPTAILTLLAVLVVVAAEQEWRAIIVPLIAAFVTGGLLAAVHLATRGGVGFGDAKLAALIGLALGTLGAGTVWLGLLAGSVIALIRRGAKREPGPSAYGPWLLVGSGIAAVVATWVR